MSQKLSLLSSPPKSDTGDPAKMKLYYSGVSDCLIFLDSGLCIRAKQRQWTDDESPPPFAWVLPSGNPPPFCGKTGHYKQLHKKQKGGGKKRQRKDAIPLSKKEVAEKKKRKQKVHESESDVESEESDDDNTWAMEAIVDGPNTAGKYLLRWLNFDPEDDTWEPTENLRPEDIQEYLDGNGSPVNY